MRTNLGLVLLCASMCCTLVTYASENYQIKENGTIRVSAFDLPESVFLSKESLIAVKRWRDIFSKDWPATYEKCPSVKGKNKTEIVAIRQCRAKAFYKTATYQNVINRYPANVTPKTIGGVYTEVFTPINGVVAKNKKRVLINVHGGAFLMGSRWISHLESIPIASLGKIKVVSIDYRLGPEHTFPAASEDVARVYRELLKDNKPENIGIYGCSAGGLLTAQTIARLQQENLPPPGAVGMFCGAGAYWSEGDSGHLEAALYNVQKPVNLGNGFLNNAYLKDIDHKDPLAFPIKSDQVLEGFPPSLLMSGTRDGAMSSVVYMHSRLDKLGVDADLHIWEGLGHAFFFNNFELPESRDAYDVIVRFFDKHLGYMP